VVTFPCAVCGASWDRPKSRSVHEGKAHPDWRPSPELRASRQRDARSRWLQKAPLAWRWIGWANMNARDYGLPPLPRDTELPTGPCAYCGGVADGWDHVVPLARGGSHTVDNLAPCCQPCNLRKGPRPPEFLERPEKVVLRCGWCWSEVTRRTAKLRYDNVFCGPSCTNRFRWSVWAKDRDGVNRYRVVERPVQVTLW
jgi:5-methylcytosine-specific restriction endonuclease McrA